MIVERAVAVSACGVLLLCSHSRDSVGVRFGELVR